MKILIQFFASLLLLFSLAACQRDLDIPLPPHEARLVVNAFAQPGQPLEVYLTRSFGPLEDLEKTDLFIADATLKLFYQGQAVGSFAYRDTLISSWGVNGDSLVRPLGKYVSQDVELLAGETYELEVAHPAYETVRATATLPAASRVYEAELRQNVERRLDGDGFSFFQSLLTVKFADDPATTDFYACRVTIEYESPWEPGVFETERLWNAQTVAGRDESGAYQEGDRWFGDTELTGDTAMVDFVLYLPNAYDQATVIEELNIRRVWIEWFTATETTHRYLESMGRQNDAKSNGFSLFPPEAIVVYSNIENGFGIFSGLSQQRFEFTP